MRLTAFNSTALSCLSASKLKFLLFLVGISFGQPLFAQTYCTSGASFTGDSNCEEVIFNTISNNSFGVCADYTDFTSISTTVSIGNVYALSVRAGTCGSDFPKSGKVYIDWNQDGDFVDPGEEVFSFGPTTPSTTFTGNVTVPGVAAIGNTRMRVVVVETSNPGSVVPCGTFSWGETEDYTVTVNPSSDNDMAAAALVSPTSGCNLTANETVTMTVVNSGTLPQTAWSVGYRVNGGAVVTEPMTGPLASGATVNHTFSTNANLGTPGTYLIEAWVSLVTDTIPQNDTTSISVTSIPGVGTYPYVEDFESGNGGWIDGGTSSSWVRGLPAKNTIQGANSGVNAFVTGGLGTNTYNSNEQSFVLGPCFDFSTLQNPWISLGVWWHSEGGWDGANLQASTDFGITWVNVGNAFDPGNWFNDNTIVSSPGGSDEGWSGGAFSSNTGSNGWVTAAHRLDGLAGQQSVRLRIAFGADGVIEDDGFAFDDVRIGEGPVVSLGNDTLLCGGDTLFADAGNFANFNWTGGVTTQVDTITSPGTYIVQVFDTNGFYDFDTIVVSYSVPTVDIGPDSTICPGDTVLLIADSTTSYLWHDGSFNQTFAATTGGPKSVTVTDSVGCEATDEMILTIAIPPSLSLGADTTVCAGEAVTLNAGGGPVGTTYDWSTGANTQVLIVSSPGMYIASVTTPGGCAAIDSMQIFNHPAPGVQLGPDRIECGTYTLNAGAGNTAYSWSNNANTPTITLTTGGTYSVTVTNSFNCSQSDTVVITHGSEPTVNLGPDQLLCNGQSIMLDAGNPGSTYLWSTGDVSQTTNATSPGLYIVTVWDAAGCEGSDTISIDGSILSVNLGPDLTICGNGNGVMLDAGNPGQTYAWSNNDNSQMTFVTTPGTYTVTVTDQDGCDAMDQITVNQTPGLVADFTNPATATLFFPVQFSDSTSPTPTQWFWDFGDGQTSTAQNPSHTYQAFGVFTITLIVSDGQCRDTITGTVDVNTSVTVPEGIDARRFEVYPIPTDGIVHLDLELNQAQDVNVSVLDLQGRTVWEMPTRKALMVREEIDLRDQAVGMYMLRVRANGREVYRRLVRR